jgi:hypothetical protein
MAQYNGHKNWNYWNVALWIGNDQELYKLARGCKREFKRKAAKAFVYLLRENGVEKTPDGAKYSIAAVDAAIKNL